MKEKADSYYNSAEWKQEREYFLKDWDGKCARCLKPVKGPVVHHIAYDGTRAFEALCKPCHDLIHGRRSYPDSTKKSKQRYARCKKRYLRKRSVTNL